MRIRGIALGMGILAVCLFAYASFDTHAAEAQTTNSLQSQIDANNAQVAQLTQEIATYEAEIQKTGADKKTLQAAINSLDLQRKKTEDQITVIQRQIDTTQLQINQLAGSIADTQNTISADKAALGEDIRIMQEDDSQSMLMELLSSQTLSDAWNDMSTILQVQSAIENDVASLGAHEHSLTQSQNASAQKKQTLVTQRSSLTHTQEQLAQTKNSKKQLLAITNAKESNYEKLLAEAQAQLASFSTFAQNAGGHGLLGNQTSCDAWGCYYNQRDSAWGNDPLNGTKYRLASDGCLITSMAMVMTHYGYHNVTPVTINSNPNNFASYYPAYLLFTINVDGVTATREKTYIDSTLAKGDPVIVGIHAYGGTHFVVLVSGSHGNYLMRDPYIANGKDISFTAHYPLSSIYAIEKVVIS